VVKGQSFTKLAPSEGGTCRSLLRIADGDGDLGTPATDLRRFLMPDLLQNKPEERNNRRTRCPGADILDVRTK
jgi:hypothetical protein